MTIHFNIYLNKRIIHALSIRIDNSKYKIHQKAQLDDQKLVYFPNKKLQCNYIRNGQLPSPYLPKKPNKFPNLFPITKQTLKESYPQLLEESTPLSSSTSWGPQASPA